MWTRKPRRTPLEIILIIYNQGRRIRVKTSPQGPHLQAWAPHAKFRRIGSLLRNSSIKMCPLMMKVQALLSVASLGTLNPLKPLPTQPRRRRSVLLHQEIVSSKKVSIRRPDNLTTPMTQGATTPPARWMIMVLSRPSSLESSKAISIWQLTQQPRWPLWSSRDPNAVATSLRSLRRPREMRSSLTGRRSLARNARNVFLPKEIASEVRKCLKHLTAS